MRAVHICNSWLSLTLELDQRAFKPSLQLFGVLVRLFNAVSILNRYTSLHDCQVLPRIVVGRSACVVLFLDYVTC